MRTIPTMNSFVKTWTDVLDLQIRNKKHSPDRYHKHESSYRDGGFSAVSKKLRLNRTISITTFHHLMENYMFFQLKVRLNIHIIQNRKITVA